MYQDIHYSFIRSFQIGVNKNENAVLTRKPLLGTIILRFYYEIIMLFVLFVIKYEQMLN